MKQFVPENVEGGISQVVTVPYEDKHYQSPFLGAYVLIIGPAQAACSKSVES